MTTSPLFKRALAEPTPKRLRDVAVRLAALGSHSGDTRWEAAQLMRQAADEIEALKAAASPEPPAEEVETLRAELRHERDLRIRLQAALMYWHPGVSEQIEIETNGRAGADAGLLAGFDGDMPEQSWGESAVLEIQTLRKDAARYRWLRDGNAFAPEEEMIQGGDELDEYIDREIARAKGDG